MYLLNSKRLLIFVIATWQNLIAIRWHDNIINRGVMNDQPTNYSDDYVTALKILTPREVEVLEKVADGYTSPEIGQELYISKQTVQKHRETICQKLDLRGYRGLFHWCREHVQSA